MSDEPSGTVSNPVSDPPSAASDLTSASVFARREYQASVSSVTMSDLTSESGNVVGHMRQPPLQNARWAVEESGSGSRDESERLWESESRDESERLRRSRSGSGSESKFTESESQQEGRSENRGGSTVSEDSTLWTWAPDEGDEARSGLIYGAEESGAEESANSGAYSDRSNGSDSLNSEAVAGLAALRGGNIRPS